MKTLPEIQRELSERTLTFRSIERLLHTDRFERVYNDLSLSDQRKVFELAEKGDKNGIITFLSSQKDYEEMNLKELRQIAIRLGITDYYSYSKSQLISRIIYEKAIPNQHPETTLVVSL